MINARVYKKLERQLKALANHRRLAMIAFIKKRGEATVGEIADQLRLSMQATSKHLKLLEAVDILSSEQRGLLVYYSLVKPQPPQVSTIIDTL